MRLIIVLEMWQGKLGLRRVKSWTGALQQMPDAAVGEDLPLDRRRLRRAMSSAANLPPLAALPPPISMGIPPPANIDMDVDFEAEIKPHLKTCLVSDSTFTFSAFIGVTCLVTISNSAFGVFLIVSISGLRRDLILALYTMGQWDDACEHSGRMSQ